MSGCQGRAWSCCLAGPWAPRALLQGPLVTFQWTVGYATETPTATVRPHSVLSPLPGHPTAPSDGPGVSAVAGLCHTSESDFGGEESTLPFLFLFSSGDASLSSRV